MQNNDGLTTCRKQWLQVYQAVTRVLTIYMEKLESRDGNSNGSPHSVWEASSLIWIYLEVGCFPNTSNFIV